MSDASVSSIMDFDVSNLISYWIIEFREESLNDIQGQLSIARIWSIFIKITFIEKTSLGEHFLIRYRLFDSLFFGTLYFLKHAQFYTNLSYEFIDFWLEN